MFCKVGPRFWYRCWIILLFLFGGTVVTLTAKWANLIKAKGNSGEAMEFRHSFIQTWGMFMGEVLAMTAFGLIKLYRWQKARKTSDPTDFPDAPKPDEKANLSANLELANEGKPATRPKFSPFWLLPPAILDLFATTLMYIGLSMTSASSYLMLRGSSIVFTAVLSRFILGHRIGWIPWLGIYLVIIGLIAVGLTDEFYFREDKSGFLIALFTPETTKEDLSSAAIGDVLIIAAQVLVACQIVYEEKYIHKFQIEPLEVVGWEGVFGISIVSLLLIPFYYIPADKVLGHNPRGVLEDAPHAFAQMGNEPKLAIAFTLFIFAVPFFNFGGMSITKEISATSKKIFDAFRTIIIWSVSLGLKWQRFAWPHLIGFFFLVIGMFVFNRIIVEPAIIYLHAKFFPRKVVIALSDAGSLSEEKETRSSRTSIRERH